MESRTHKLIQNTTSTEIENYVAKTEVEYTDEERDFFTQFYENFVFDYTLHYHLRMFYWTKCLRR